MLVFDDAATRPRSHPFTGLREAGASTPTLLRERCAPSLRRQGFRPRLHRYALRIVEPCGFPASDAAHAARHRQCRGNAMARPCLTSLRSLRGTPHANCRHYSVMRAHPRAWGSLHARQPVPDPPTTPPAVVERGLVGGYQIETGRKACFVLRLKTPPTPAAREGGASRVQAKGSILNGE